MNNNRGFEDKRFDDIHEAIDMLNKEIDNTFERIDKFKRNIKIAGIVAGTAIVAFIVKNVIAD